MPITPLHLGPAWLLFLTSRRGWSFAGLSVGSMIPDIEIPILLLSGIEKETGHGALHSILGGLVIGVFLSVSVVYLLLPTFADWWIGRLGAKWVYFAGINASQAGKVPRIAGGAAAGVMTHLCLDFLTHKNMPYLWPSVDLISTFSFAREWWWMAIVDISLLILLIFLLRRYLGKTEKANRQLKA